MMNEIQDPDTAWAEFRMRSQDRIAKTSIAGQMDTLASMLRSVEANVGELSDLLIPRLAGEQHATTMATEAGPTSDDPLADVAGGMPEEQPGQPPQDVIEKSEEEEDVKNEDKPVDEETEEVEEFTTDDDEPEAMFEDDGGKAPPEVEDVEEVDVTAEKPAEGDAPGEEVPVEAEAAIEEPASATPAEDPLIGGYKAFSDAMKEAAHRAIDSGRTELIGRFVEAQAEMDSVWQTVICPLMDALGATDAFSKSTESPDVFVKGHGCVDKAMDAPKVPAPESAPRAGGAESTEALAKSESMIDEVSDADSHGTASEGDVPLDDVADKSPDHGTAPEGDVPVDDVDVAKTADICNSDGEHEEDLTEFEKNGEFPSIRDLLKGGAAKQRMDSMLDEAWERHPVTNQMDYIFSGGFEKSAKTAEPVQASADAKSEDVGTVADVQENADVPITKHIETFEEALNRHRIYKCGSRPQVVSTTGGDVTRPELEFEPVEKSQQKVRMGYGVDPKSVTADDWAEYHRFIQSRNASL